MLVRKENDGGYQHSALKNKKIVYINFDFCH